MPIPFGFENFRLKKYSELSKLRVAQAWQPKSTIFWFPDTRPHISAYSIQFARDILSR